MVALTFLTNVYLWIGIGLTFMLLFVGLLIFVILLAKKTHAIIEFKAFMKGIPIALFFQENRYVEWKPVKPEAGIVTDENYGAFIINEKATYIDKRTKNVMIPFDAQFAASINVHAAKLVDDLAEIITDEKQLQMLRRGIAEGTIEDSESINVIKTSVNFGAIKTMMTALIPHNINSKIEKIIAARLKSYGQINIPQIAFIFIAIFGAILLGAIILRSVLKK